MSMTNELKIILAIGIIVTVFWNLSVVVWTNTPYDIQDTKLELACVQGGGKVVYGGNMNYLQCDK